jgi:hypothetical protein
VFINFAWSFNSQKNLKKLEQNIERRKCLEENFRFFSLKSLSIRGDACLQGKKEMFGGEHFSHQIKGLSDCESIDENNFVCK